ncbi:MAG: IS1595 family transposase [Bryobacteraceae bacterium]|jgi:transposase-like protein
MVEEAKTEPTTLLEAIRYYADLDVATKTFAALRWPDGPICPYCQSKRNFYAPSRRIWKCKTCRKQFSPKVGTICEDSPIGMDKWMAAIWLITNDKNGISSLELHRALGVTQKTAWFMLQRIRLAMQTESFEKAAGEVEIDETFVGGKARNMHKHVRERKITGTGGKDKTAVMAILERGGPIRAGVVPTRKKALIQAIVREHVTPGAEIFTDALKSYEGLDDEYLHQFVDHTIEYVNGKVHTNGVENFWSMFKRTLKGTYVSVAPFHTFRYVDEQVFRYNHRNDACGDLGRFRHAVRCCAGKRLTYKRLTGKTSDV